MAETKGAQTIDGDAVARLRATAERLAIRTRGVFRAAPRISEQERQRLLEAFDRLVAGVPPRPLKDLERELSELRRSRRRGGRRSDAGHRHG